jgi:hypothetical protein
VCPIVDVVVAIAPGVYYSSLHTLFPQTDVVVAIAPGVYYSSLHTLSPLGQILGPAPARS